MLRHRNVNRVVIFFICVFYSCNQSDDPKNFPNTPTSGVITVCADNTFHYILSSPVELFRINYRNTRVSLKFKGEKECISDLLMDSCKVIIISRSLSKEEEKVFQKKNLIIQQTPIAKSGVVLLGYCFKDKGISVDSLKSILLGKNDKVAVVFYLKNNGSVWYVKDSLLNGQSFGKNCFFVEDTATFRKYVSDTKKSVLGIIDYAMVCDDDDKWTRSVKYFNNDTLVIPVRERATKPAYYPDQSNIATGDYPFVRFIYCIRRGDNFSLSAGIEAFLAGEKGQLSFKKEGLVPLFDRERKIEIKPY